MTNYNFKKNRRPWTYLSKIDLLGAFDFITLTVTFESLQTRQYDQLQNLLCKNNYKEQLITRQLDPAIYSLIEKIFPLAMHEYTHFLDTTSTVWGLQYMTLLQSAFQMRNSPQEFRETNFERCKILYDASRSIALPKFFTEIFKSVACDRPWKFRISRGKRYTAHGTISKTPVIFISFYNESDQKFLRSPISTSSLLEASAMNQELMAKTDLVNALERDTRLVEAAKLERNELLYLFNKDITEYSVCVHLVAFFQNCNDAIDSFQLAGKIALLALNFTEEAMNQITYSSVMLDKLGFSPDSEASMEFIEDAKMNDRGFLFYMIAMLTPEGATGSLEKAIGGIVEALEIMGINLDQVLNLADERIFDLATELGKSKSLAISSYANSAVHNHNHRNLDSPFKNEFTEFHLPPAIFGDFETRCVFPSLTNKLLDFDVNTASDQMIPMQIWTENFAEACM